MLSIIERHLFRTTKLFARSVHSDAFRFVGGQELREHSEKHSELETNVAVKEQPCTKSLTIAILGSPNAGKSTLINQLVNRNLCATSSKVHTTSCKASAVYTENDTQLVFVDTPGVVNEIAMKRHRLISSFGSDPKQSVRSADVVGIVHDASNQYTNFQISPDLLNILNEQKFDIPIFLILNKVDCLKNKSLLLAIAKHLSENKAYPAFEEIFMISALTGSGLNAIRARLLALAKPRKWRFDATFYTDQTVETLIEKTVRSRYMEYLPSEVAYVIQINADEAQINSDGGISAVVRVTCARSRVSGLALGKQGSVVKSVVKESEDILRHALRVSVMLKIIVETKKQSNT